jgi:lipopolysaccharide/colanic/teichoic acid biosynthesis glycosyltransferase
MVYRLFKRFFDFFGALFGLVVLSPLFLVVAILVKLSSPGPIFFKQERYGKNGKIFKVWKFRTMKNGSENLSYTVEQLREFESSSNDPRINKITRFLRKYALDEIPQLINILKGEISFVGPRAYFKKRVENDEKLKQRLKIKPGLTCLVAVKGGVKLSEAELLKLDLEYINKQNLFLDIKILLKSIFLVVSGRGF